MRKRTYTLGLYLLASPLCRRFMVIADNPAKFRTDIDRCYSVVMGEVIAFRHRFTCVDIEG